ncbi:Queuosine salvage protein [Phytophthora citrophthora]|uniref:Queuosine 5'-phosphate N-glycosylase/hydrolase n=1 Tax=Phytophthora citrophthora TaxID=4793 RepID=A0AAD9G4W5_9STRA|nr:Queuosine salvage protein [Phytophthora citrophthora]
MAASSFLARVRPSCSKLVENESSSVRINADKVRAFVEDLDVKEFEQLAEPMNFPLNFRSQQDEINFLTLYGLLNFGSGFRKDLHKYTDRGAHDTIVSIFCERIGWKMENDLFLFVVQVFGLIGMYISVPKLDAQFMQNLSIDLVANYFSIPLEQDEQISPGIYMAKPGPLKPLAVILQKILNESGQKLIDLKMEDFGAFVLANLSPKTTGDLEEKEAVGTGPSAAYLVDRFVETFPGFDDHYEIHGEEVYLLKRAQLSVACIYRRFKDSEPKLTFADINELTAFSDNVLPCVLHALGVLEYDAELEERIKRGEELPAGQQECELRAAAVVASDLIVAESEGRLGSLELDFYLWRVGKEERFRGIERHATRDTFFY